MTQPAARSAKPGKMQYTIAEESSGNARVVRVTQRGILLRPVPWWVGLTTSGYLLIFLGWWVWILWWLVARMRAELERERLPNLATFVLVENKLHVHAFQPKDWKVASFSWNRDAIAVFRPNRYCPGFYVHIRGVTMDTIVENVPDDLREDICRRLGFAQDTAPA